MEFQLGLLGGGKEETRSFTHEQLSPTPPKSLQPKSALQHPKNAQHPAPYKADLDQLSPIANIRDQIFHRRDLFG